MVDIESVQTLELIFRFAAISQLLLVAFILVRQHRDKPSGLIAAAFAISVTCYLLVDIDRNWGLWEYALLVGAIIGPVLLWLLARSLFDDHFQAGWRDLTILFGVLAVTLACVAAYDADANSRELNLLLIVIPQGLNFAFVLMALLMTLKDWRVDLVESRRRVRVILVIVAGGHSIVVVVANVLLASAPNIADTAPLNLINAIVIFLIIFAFNCAGLSMHPGILVGRVADEQHSEHPAEDFGPVLVELHQLMDDRQLYKEHGLTIGRLAEAIGIQEYKLRRIINGHYGYRNFNQYLNRYRIKDASERLTAPDTRRLPVLTIALDVGYSSLGPFNKAFKETHGMTPTEYRRSGMVSSN